MSILGKFKEDQIKKLPVGTIYNADNDKKYEDVYIETPKNSYWVHYYTQDGKAHSIPMIFAMIDWKEKWK